MSALLSKARSAYHGKLLNNILVTDKKGIPSNADKDSKSSVLIATGIMHKLSGTSGTRSKGQTAGSKFEEINTWYLNETFPKLAHLRPGNWEIKRIGNKNRLEIAQYEQFAHLIALHQAAKGNPDLAAALGNDYTITPDTIIARYPEDDATINKLQPVVDQKTALKTSLRKANQGKPLLHASISSKWTIRSDRAQNSRSEALNLIRNRKGHLPHVAVVTGEPLPSRLSSIALGTGDIDCVYHFALYELLATVEELGLDDPMESLQIMVRGNRLKDISDLPLDLAV